jgi:NADPH:quinone reductase-like Zn-dependent oxidoreductase
MKAIQYNSYSGIDGMAMAETPTPVPGDDEVLVKIYAAGVNPVDLAVSQGYLKDFRPLAFPIIPGCEIAGTVERVGATVRNFVRGDAVHGTPGMAGAFAEYVAIKSLGLVHRPQRMDFNEAAGLPIAAATAISALDAGAVGPGTRLLIHAAAGGVGSVAVQMAKARGAEVTALASAGNVAFVQSLGADHVIDRASRYEDQLRGFDVVLDAFGVAAQARSWSTLRKGGILLSLVTAPSQEEADKYGVRVAMVYGAPTAAALAQADDLVSAGKLKVHVSRTYPLSKAIDALREVATGKVRGKVVVTPFVEE